MRDNGDWTCHHNYDQISALTQLEMGEFGKVSKTSAKAIQKQVDELMLEAFADGYSLDGGSITHDQYKKLLKSGWRPEFEFQQCYTTVYWGGKFYDWYDLSDARKEVILKSGEYFDMEEIW